MAETALGNSLNFLTRLGIFDVVLPFLLVFTIVFAILEKTKIFGTDKVKDKTLTRKNLNSMTAFVTAFFVVASSQLVAMISQVMANMVLLLLLSICFMILVGSFHGEQDKEGFVLDQPFKGIFMAVMFIGIVVIFLDALGWLNQLFNFLANSYDSEWVMSIFLVLVTIGIMLYVTGFSFKKGSDNDKKGDS